MDWVGGVFVSGSGSDGSAIPGCRSAGRWGIGRIFYRRGSAPLCSRGEGLGGHGQRRTLRRRGYTFSGRQGMAELISPNGTWIRIGNNTQIQFITRDTDLSEVDVASGVARFYNKSSATVIEATSPFGYVLGASRHGLRLLRRRKLRRSGRGERGRFVDSATETKYNVTTGSPSILADPAAVSSGEGNRRPDWNRWNMGREIFWAAKARVRGRSVEYLPPSPPNESYALDETGRWEKVPYEGTERWFWRPTTVVASSSPFTVGRWTDGTETKPGSRQNPSATSPTITATGVDGANRTGPTGGKRARRSPPPQPGLLLVSRKGFMDSQWLLCGLGASGAARKLLQLSPLGRPSECGRNQRQFRADQHQPPELYLRQPGHRCPPEGFLWGEQLQECTGDQRNPTTIINNYRAAPVINNTVIKNYTTIDQRYNYTNVKVREASQYRDQPNSTESGYHP